MKCHTFLFNKILSLLSHETVHIIFRNVLHFFLRACVMSASMYGVQKCDHFYGFSSACYLCYFIRQGAEVHILTGEHMKVSRVWTYRDSNSPTGERLVVLPSVLAIPCSSYPCEIFRKFPRRNILNRHERIRIREGGLSEIFLTHK